MKPRARIFGIVASLVILIILSVVLVARASMVASAPASELQENKNIVNRYYKEVWNQGNLAALDTLLGDQFVDEQACAIEELAAGQESRAGLKQLIAGIRDSFTNMNATIDDMVAEGNLVTVRSTFTGTFAPSGQQVTFSGIEMWRVEDGKLQERWGYFDVPGLLNQVGILPPPTIGTLPAPPEDFVPPTVEDQAVVIRYYQEVWNLGDLTILDELIAPDFVDHNPDPGQTPDEKGFKQSVIQFGTGFSGFDVVVNKLETDEDRIKVSTTFNAIFKPTGQRVSFDATELWRVVDGLLVERWGEADTTDLAQDFGMLP